MMLAAPGLFSITTDLPRRSCSFCATMRDTMSVVPPGAIGSTNRIGLSGYWSANTGNTIEEPISEIAHLQNHFIASASSKSLPCLTYRPRAPVKSLRPVSGRRNMNTTIYQSYLLLNAKVITVDRAVSIAQAIAIRGDRIICVGSNSDARTAAGSKAMIVDLKGRTVIPGLIDGH